MALLMGVALATSAVQRDRDTTSGVAGVGTPLSDHVDGYVALVPRVLRANQPASFSVSLFDGANLAQGKVGVAVLRQGKVIAQTAAQIAGKGTVALNIPPVTPGTYDLAVSGPGFTKSAQVQVQDGTLLFLETDKPIYKPGQTIHMRVVALDADLKPVRTDATIDILDAKGVKVFKQEVATDEFGMATLELPLSTEPNLGVWKLQAQAGDASTDLDVRVEEYVLPKYEVTAELTKDWFLVNEPITGHVAAEYSFGKPVSGELQVTASRYVGVWEEFATFAAQIDGEGDFTLDPAGYVAGTPEGGGMGNVQLDIAVAEKATGYEEKTTELITVAASAVNIKLIPETPSFKPGLPYNLLVVTETPSGEPVDATLSFTTQYTDENWNDVGRETQTVSTSRGTALMKLEPPAGAQFVSLEASVGDAYAGRQIGAAYSPSGSFVHVEQVGAADLAVGDTARFSVVSTAAGGSYFYEVVSRDRVVFTGSTGTTGSIAFAVTPAMAPSSRLLVYQILPNSEVAADSLPFEVASDYPLDVTAGFDREEATPGEGVQVQVQTGAPAKVGLVAVDRSVFILAENRLNLQQVFAELERLYMQPQAELHEAEFMFPSKIPGAEDTFTDAGLLVLTDKTVPEGKELENMAFAGRAGGMALDAAPGGPVTTAAAATTTTAAGMAPAAAEGTDGLAEVKRVRQFFPETWIWDEVTTDASGRATLDAEAPDSITTWDLRAVAVSPEKGLGVSESSLKVFQPLFLSADLPYSAIRGEEFPVKIALYNYLDTPQELTVELKGADWFELLGVSTQTVTVAGNDVGGVEFRIRPTGIGTQLLEVSARGPQAADAVIKSMIVEPEGVERETVENLVLKAGTERTLELALPDSVLPVRAGSGTAILPAAPNVVPDSARAYVALTGSLLAQTIDGLDALLQMPFGCGEQNMILFAPDVFILKYLQETRQVKPEIQAKAELLLITGYQRELTYRRDDGSFSAFGQQDPEGSLWLTAFVLKSFAQAKDLVFVDPVILSEASSWIQQHQGQDGSFQPVGFVHHQEMVGGVSGTDAMAAYVTIALLEAEAAGVEGAAGAAASRAAAYLEGRLDQIEDPYALALVTYALELADSPRAADAYDRLMAAARQDEDGLHWGAAGDVAAAPGLAETGMPGINPVLDIETTAYAMLALIEHGDRVSAAQAARWLVGNRNSGGGFGSTQDTVVALQALTTYSAQAAGDTDMTVTITAGDVAKDVVIDPSNFDVTQVIQVPAGVPVRLEARGTGEAVVQGVLRYNLAQAEETRNVFDISVDYATEQVEVNDTVDVNVAVRFTPPEAVKAGMTVLDVSVPTGFAPVTEALDALVGAAGSAGSRITRYDVAGRKVIVYIEDMSPGEELAFIFQVRALYPVRAKEAASQVYAYYTPSWRGETLSAALSVGDI
ncbi:MAG: alpha-2-macroglobulin [Gaiellales bacterium]|nr:alpha-2-macroglobulin [Gaiellales bacterium]